MFQVDVFWAVTPCSVVVGYQLFSEVHAASIFRAKWPGCHFIPCRSLHPEDGGSMGLRNIAFLPQNYMTS